MEELELKQTKKRMHEIAHAIGDRIPEELGFILLIFPMQTNYKKRDMNLMSTATRETTIDMLHSAVDRLL